MVADVAVGVTENLGRLPVGNRTDRVSPYIIFGPPHQRLAEGHADIFLTYCTNAVAAQKENPRQQIVNLHDNLAVGADYGLTVISGSSP
jgi:hypothetical protein